MNPELQAILEAMMGRPGAALPFNDPRQIAEMQRKFWFDPASGDPVVSIGMDTNKVRHMTDPDEKESSMGVYYRGEDAVYLNPDLSDRDYAETAHHEFRHRGARILDEAAGRPPQYNIEELAMLMSDMSGDIGTFDNNTASIGSMQNDYAIKNKIKPMDVLRKADGYATILNHEARAAIGQGAPYQSPVDELIQLMIPAYVGGPR